MFREYENVDYGYLKSKYPKDYALFVRKMGLERIKIDATGNLKYGVNAMNSEIEGLTAKAMEWRGKFVNIIVTNAQEELTGRLVDIMDRYLLLEHLCGIFCFIRMDEVAALVLLSQQMQEKLSGK